MNKTRWTSLIVCLAVLVGIFLLLLWAFSRNLSKRSEASTTREASTRSDVQEFIIVRVKDEPNVQAGVLINGKRNGTTGVPITLGSPGWVVISVDLPKAKEQSVNVKHTTATHPMNIEIDCD